MIRGKIHRGLRATTVLDLMGSPNKHENDFLKKQQQISFEKQQQLIFNI